MKKSLRPSVLFLPFAFAVLLTTMPGFGQVEFRKPTWQDINPRTTKNKQQESGFSAKDNTRDGTGFSGNRLSNNDQPNSNSNGAFSFASSAKTNSPKPIVTRQSSFSVPFKVNPAAGPLREVQLHVSTNRGTSWSLYSRQLPTARGFPFRANADGEYWFAVKTVGSTVPAKKLTPELIISIDSRRPTFNVSLKTDALGRLVVGWRAADENLDANSVNISYLPATNWGRQASTWQQVKIPKVERDIQTVYEDEIAFYPNTSNVSIDLRISIQDKAGNVTVVTRRYNLPRTAFHRQKNLPPIPDPRSEINSPMSLSGLHDQPTWQTGIPVDLRPPIPTPASRKRTRMLRRPRSEWKHEPVQDRFQATCIMIEWPPAKLGNRDGRWKARRDTQILLLTTTQMRDPEIVKTRRFQVPSAIPVFKILTVWLLQEETSTIQTKPFHAEAT